LTGPGSLPPIAVGAMPANVRNGSPQDQAAWRTAVGFERLLVAQLAQRLAATAQPDDDAGDAAGAAYRDMLPDALADGVASAGGLGLADDLYRTLRTGSEGR
jgi:Rod binding domain-containing protein